MNPTSVYAVSSRMGLPVWLLARATSIQLANSKPTGSPPCLGGATHTSSITEVAEWVQTLAPPNPSPPSPVILSTPHPPVTLIPPPLRHRRRSPRLQSRISSASALTTFLIVYFHAPADLNLDGTVQPLRYLSPPPFESLMARSGCLLKSRS
jgi:hypothetical protein